MRLKKPERTRSDTGVCKSERAARLAVAAVANDRFGAGAPAITKPALFSLAGSDSLP